MGIVYRIFVMSERFLNDFVYIKFFNYFYQFRQLYIGFRELLSTLQTHHEVDDLLSIVSVMRNYY